MAFKSLLFCVLPACAIGVSSGMALRTLRLWTRHGVSLQVECGLIALGHLFHVGGTPWSIHILVHPINTRCKQQKRNTQTDIPLISLSGLGRHLAQRPRGIKSKRGTPKRIFLLSLCRIRAAFGPETEGHKRKRGTLFLHSSFKYCRD